MKIQADKIFRSILVFLFVIFIALYISQSTGYYEYEQYKKVALTNEQIKQFENDVKEGKNVDVKDYVSETKKEYGNKVSNAGLRISKEIEKHVTKFINGIFESLSKVVNDKSK